MSEEKSLLGEISDSNSSSIEIKTLKKEDIKRLKEQQENSEKEEMGNHHSINTNEKEHVSLLIKQNVDNQLEYDRRNCFSKSIDFILRKKKYFARTIFMDGRTEPTKKFCRNAVNNRKYNLILFPLQFLYEQFKNFSNFYYLLNALSQLIPPLQVGYTFTYVAPLVFVLCVTLVKELWDELRRFLKDLEINREKYERINKDFSMEFVSSSNLKVGDLIKIKCDQRVPADCILIRTTEKTGHSFIRTSALDGETDWKLRHTLPYFQKKSDPKDSVDDAMLPSLPASFYIDPPKKDIYSFFGRCSIAVKSIENSNNTSKEILPTDEKTYHTDDSKISKDDVLYEQVEPLGLENTMWMNTYVATGDVIGMVIYTGKETRCALNTQDSKTKTGRLDKELNTEMELLFVLMVVLSLLLTLLKYNFFLGPYSSNFSEIMLKIWNYILDFLLYTILLSCIIPISLKVNMDVSKGVYGFFINRDKKIKGTVCRNTSIPEELGRINHLFCDKTGTLTKNEMIFKRFILAPAQFFTAEDMETLISLSKEKNKENLKEKDLKSLWGLMAMALCHNVTPILSEDNKSTKYEASSPDEIALVQFCERAGMKLSSRSTTEISIRQINDEMKEYDILLMFPFTSTEKRMGIFLKEKNNNNEKIIYLMKGADAVMKNIIKKNESGWLSDEVDNLAREGLRTLVFAKKEITKDEYSEFLKKLKEAQSAIGLDADERFKKVELVRSENMEKDMDIVGISGVEDLLQDRVQEVLENLQHANVRVWMLTGDKVETAVSIGRATRLISKNFNITYITGETQLEGLSNKIDSLLQNSSSSMLDDNEGRGYALVIDGASLQLALENSALAKKFAQLATKKCASVVVARCSPTQKAKVVALIKKNDKKVTTCSIGDGGNDVSMILESHVGVGIVGKEGKQASLAADFSVNEFQCVERLLLWHGANCYRKGVKMSQFIVHRGLIISVMQCIFSALNNFSTEAIFDGTLMACYSTLFTVLPVFALCMDEEVSEKTVMEFPEIYADLLKRKLLSWKVYFVWIWKAFYQGGFIMLIQIILQLIKPLQGDVAFKEKNMQVLVCYTSLLFVEFLMIGFSSLSNICYCHINNLIMMLSELISVALYIISIFIFFFYDLDLLFSISDFWWKTLIIVMIACFPIYLFDFIIDKIKPHLHNKLRPKQNLITNFPQKLI